MNWLLIAVVLFFAVMVVTGYKRGFAKMLVSTGSTLLSVICAVMLFTAVSKMFGIGPVKAFICVFIFLRIALFVVSLILRLVSKLPVLHEINGLIGAVLAGAHALLLLWIGGLILLNSLGTERGEMLYSMVRESTVLSMLYDHNILPKLLAALIEKLLKK